MKIAIISDTHDNMPNLDKALVLIKKENCQELIHCGDLCAPFMIEELAKFNGKVHAIFGNIADRDRTIQKAKEFNINFYGDRAEFTSDDKKIAVDHYPQNATNLADSGKYDLVCYGHTHKPSKEKINNCWLINPGSLFGRPTKPSFAIYNTETKDIKHFNI